VDIISGSELFWLVLLPASLFDIWQYKVPNALITAALMISLIRHFDAQGFIGLYLWLIGTIVPFILTFIFYKLRMLGASDVKFFSAVGSFAGVTTGIRIMVVSLFVGAVLSVFKILCRKNLRRRFNYFFHYIRECIKDKKLNLYYDRETEGEDGIIPFTVAISLAAILCLY
jgi:prepilin peptidase CpaA